MNDRALRLLDACLEAYDLYNTPKDVTGDGKAETFCNFATHHVAVRMGYEKLGEGRKPMLASQMVDFLKRSPEWERIGMESAQALANEGRLVVAGVADEPHGHVVVIRPGVEEYSPKWGLKAPKACDVGGKSDIGKTLAWAFADVPEIWVLK